MKKTRVLLTAVLSLALAGTAMAQAPQNSVGGNTDPGKETVRYPEKGTQEGVEYIRVDMDENAPWISYLTVGKKLPYYVAPSFLTYPNFANEAADKLHMTEATKYMGGKISTWAFTEEGSTLLTIDGINANKADITGNEVGLASVKVLETPGDGSPFHGCAGGAASVFQVNVTGKPEFSIASATVGTVAGIQGHYSFDATTAYDDARIGETCPALLIQSCQADKLNGQQLTIKFNDPVEDGNDKDALKKYAFSMVKKVGKIDGQNAVTQTGSDVKLDNPLAKKVQTQVDYTEDVTGLAVDPGSVDYNEWVYILQKPTDATTTDDKHGVISAISQRSDGPKAAEFTAYDFTGDDPKTVADKNFVVVVRLTLAPKTGPIYHIPNSANI